MSYSFANKKMIKEYFKNRNGYVISIKAPKFLIGNGNKFYRATSKNPHIFICEYVDVFKPIDKQLKKIKSHLKKYRIIGIKIYLGYQPVLANDYNLFPVYDFAKENGLSVVLHCGVGAGNLKRVKNVDYKSLLSIEEVAQEYPEVNFIMSHFADPHFEECAKIVCENKNIFTDISGEYENLKKRPYDELINKYMKRITPVIDKFGKNVLAKKTMMGTDYFGIGSGFDAIEEYFITCEMLFGKENIDNCLWKNCLKAYPKIKEYLYIEK